MRITVCNAEESAASDEELIMLLIRQNSQYVVMRNQEIRKSYDA